MTHNIKASCEINNRFEMKRFHLPLYKLETVSLMLETVSLMFKLIQGGNKSPAFSCNLHLNPCKYNTRNKAQYITHHCKTTVAKQSFSYQGPFIWNSLPANLKTSNQTFKCFRNNLKKFLLNESI